MPDIAFECPHCNQSLEAPDDMAGEVIECPACEQPIEIPGSAGEEAGVPTAKECPSCGATMEIDAVLCVTCGFHLGLGKRIDTSLS